MRTKKDITKWWEKEGYKENALEDFNDKIDDEQIKVEAKQREVEATYYLDVTLTSTRWKYPLLLIFEQATGICVHIRGF